MGCMEASMFPVENQLDGGLGNARSHTLACQHVTGQTWEAGLLLSTHTHKNTHSHNAQTLGEKMPMYAMHTQIYIKIIICIHKLPFLIQLLSNSNLK